jgi:hypothetical protein
MSASELYGTPQETLEETAEETPRTDGPQAHTTRTRRPRRGLRRGLGLLAGLLALAVVGVLAYNLGTSYFALNGAWYGPLQVQVGPGRVSLEAYMDLATYLNGSLSGSGKVCYENPLGGGTTSVDLKVTGNRNADKVTLAFAASTSTLGIPLLSIALGPELDLHGGLKTDPAKTPVAGTPFAGLLVNGAATNVTLSGGNGAFPVALEMQRGVMAQFTSACAALST